MANHKSALKARRQADKRRLNNRMNRSRLRTEIKKLRVLIASGETDQARERLRPTLGLLDHSVALGVLHRNAASRTKSRLSRCVNRLAASA
ncbi:MAG: 30S ribosomal protein S20 [Acidobacteriota bacterium]